MPGMELSLSSPNFSSREDADNLSISAVAAEVGGGVKWDNLGVKKCMYCP
mgnify:CR=1 FL=1